MNYIHDKDLIMRFTILILSFYFGLSQCHSQEISWWNPASHEFQVTEGQFWPKETVSPFDRLPARAEALVREPVWNLSMHSAGLMIRFRSNASEIKVRYSVSGSIQMNHMPATGVSGVDLYAIDSDGKWMWCRGNRKFEDTIQYDFKALKPDDGYHDKGREYRLYLPLYNNVEWLEIGVDEESYFAPLPVRKEKPIVVYGTSIAHGACASRPGMAWTAILSRKMDRQLINLAFSGNGRLEEELISLITEVDAKIYILDCLPNLVNAKTYDDEELTRRITESVKTLRSKRPNIPILLVDHAGYTDGLIQTKRQDGFTRTNRIQRQVYEELIKQGTTDLHYLSHKEIDLQLDDMVDGTHPNDLGMQHYADAYEKKLREVLNEPVGIASTTRPVIQYREPGNYDWEDRHNELLAMAKTEQPKQIIIANSIIHFWGGQPEAKLARETGSWDQYFTPLGLRNYAYGWDRLENILWRIYHDELDGFDAEKVVMMIGTNNLHLNTNEEILEGLELIIKAIKVRQANAEIMVLGILPRRDYEERLGLLNGGIEKLSIKLQVNYDFIGQDFLNSEGKIVEGLFSDGLHPNKEGYLRLRQPLLKIIK